MITREKKMLILGMNTNYTQVKGLNKGTTTNNKYHICTTY